MQFIYHFTTKLYLAYLIFLVELRTLGVKGHLKNMTDMTPFIFLGVSNYKFEHTRQSTNDIYYNAQCVFSIDD